MYFAQTRRQQPFLGVLRCTSPGGSVHSTSDGRSIVAARSQRSGQAHQTTRSQQWPTPWCPTECFCIIRHSRQAVSCHHRAEAIQYVLCSRRGCEVCRARHSSQRPNGSAQVGSSRLHITKASVAWQAASKWPVCCCVCGNYDTTGTARYRDKHSRER